MKIRAFLHLARLPLSVLLLFLCSCNIATEEQHPKPIILSHANSLVQAVAFRPNGSEIATAVNPFTRTDYAIFLWNITEPITQPTVLRGHTGVVRSLAYSSDGSILVSGSEDGSIRLWDLNNIAADPIAIENGCGQAVSLVLSVAISPDSRQVAAGCFDGSITLWDARHPMSEPISLKGYTGTQVYSVTFSPDGQHIAADTPRETISVWDVANPNEPPLVLNSQDRGITSISFTPDSKSLVSGSFDGTVWVLSASKPGPPQHVLSPASAKGQGSPKAIYSVAVDPGGRLVAAGGSEDMVMLWDINGSGLPLKTLPGHTSRITSVAFSPDGQKLASASDDGTVRLWDLHLSGVLPAVSPSIDSK